MLTAALSSVWINRRFDEEHLRLKAHIRKSGVPSRIFVESKDPVPADPNMVSLWLQQLRSLIMLLSQAFVVRNSCCHDVDLLAWLFPDSKIAFDAEKSNFDETDSVIQLQGKIKHKDSSSSEFHIDYAKIMHLMCKRLL